VEHVAVSGEKAALKFNFEHNFLEETGEMRGQKERTNIANK
jgi:hypothetical protein